jgi:hypothetical protein
VLLNGIGRWHRKEEISDDDDYRYDMTIDDDDDAALLLHLSSVRCMNTNDLTSLQAVAVAVASSSYISV